MATAATVAFMPQVEATAAKQRDALEARHARDGCDHWRPPASLGLPPIYAMRIG